MTDIIPIAVLSLVIIIGAACITVGIFNIRGNISALHSYHRSRVSKDDVLPLGRLVGLSLIIMGASIITFGALSIATVVCERSIFIIVGSAILLFGFAISIPTALYSIKKYIFGLVFIVLISRMNASVIDQTIYFC